MEVAATNSSGNALVRNFPWLTVLAGGLILLQAILAGRFLFKGSDLIDVHGMVGNATFIVAVLLVIAAWLGRQSGVLGSLDFTLTAVLLVLVIVQLALGYGGRDNLDQAALHIPNGVLIMGVSSALIALSFNRRSTT